MPEPFLTSPAMNRPLHPPRSLARIAQRLALGFVITAMATHSSRAQDAKGPSAVPQQDWLRLVPGDARFYVEIRDLREIRQLFRALGIWDLTRELAAASTPEASSQPWQRSAEALLGLDPDTAISEILGRRSALFASESSQWQNGVLMAELAEDGDLKSLLKRWDATESEPDGPVRRYLLRGGIQLAVRERLIVLGAAGDPDGLWRRSVSLLAGKRGANLAARSEVASLRIRLSREYPALLYVAWPDDDPTALAGCKRLLVGADVTPKEIVSEWRGQLATRRNTPAAPCLGSELPASTLAAYSSAADFAEFSRRAAARKFELTGSWMDLVAGSVAGIDEGSEKFIPTMGPGYCVAIGSRRPSEPGEVEFPALAAIVATGKDSGGVERFNRIMRVLAQILHALAGGSAESGEMGDQAVKQKRVAETDIYYIDVGKGLSRRLGLDALRNLQIVWASTGARAIVSSSLGQAEEIVRASRGAAPRLGAEPGTPEAGPESRVREEGPLAEWAYVRGTSLARMLTSWMDYLRERSPEALSASWWREWAARRIERRTRLGLGLQTSRTDSRYAEVREISSGSPVSELLHEGDVIVAVDGRPLTTTQPAAEIAERYRHRGSSGQFELRVLREGELMDIRVPVPPADPLDLREFDPVRALNQLILLTRRIDTLTLHRYANKPDRLDARLRIRWVERSPT